MATAWRADAQHTSAPPIIERPLHVLVVEDNPDCALSLTMLLRHNGFVVDVATTGPAALASIQACAPDVVLMDIGLPEMDGYQVAGRLRELSVKKPLLIALTGYGQEADRQRSRDEGFAYHFVKPADPLELIALLNDYARSISPADAVPTGPARLKWKPEMPSPPIVYSRPPS
jgi:CheY-like chemotaxis protein